MGAETPVYHVVVVGFHHKKGCQVEYAYPPFENELENTAWKHLPTLAMPDGAHNYETDTVYFHLPSLKNRRETVFGVACYQQIDASKLTNKPEDVTRSTVQKSVCVLSRFPLYGHIQVKMSLITAAYFRRGDFDQVSILKEAYNNLNLCLNAELLRTPEALVGLSPRDLVFQFRHSTIILFKLLLLEKKVLFRGSSVGPLCSSLLTLISLLPLTLEYGLNESACVKTQKTLSMVPQFSTQSTEEPVEQDKKSKDLSNARIQEDATDQGQVEDDEPISQSKFYYSLDTAMKRDNSETSSLCSEKQDEVPDFITAVQLSPSDAGLPLGVFTKGYLCHPYLSLHYMDLLTDSRVRGFVVGATNILFKQKQDLVDVVVEMQDSSISISDLNLKKILTPTTADLRFIDNIVRQVTQEGTRSEDAFMDGAAWEGGDEWIRAQFKYYLVCLMRTSLLVDGARQCEAFNRDYLSAWKQTSNWVDWEAYVNSEERDTPGVYALCPGHPFEGNMGVGDVKIKLAHSMNSSENARKLNQAVGKAVSSTGKAVGGAISHARGALSSWWSSVTTAPGGEEVPGGAHSSGG